MNAAQFHLMVNHLPLFAVIFGGGLLAYGLMQDQRALKSAGLVLGVIGGLGGVLATRSGERAEEIVEQYEGTNEEALEAHEESGKQAQLALIALGLVSLIALLIPAKREKLRSRFEWGAWFVFLAALAMVARTASKGGAIRHPEIDYVPSEVGHADGVEDRVWESVRLKVERG